MASNLEKALSFKLEAFNLLYVLCDYETLLKKISHWKNLLIYAKRRI
jgi:thiamine-phosphate pyrophosphorylase